MEEASAIGDLQTVKEIFERFLIPGGEGMSLEERTLPGSALYLEVSLCQAWPCGGRFLPLRTRRKD
jgi:hypothetical protein